LRIYLDEGIAKLLCLEKLRFLKPFAQKAAKGQF
jgi:hypothetical protein